MIIEIIFSKMMVKKLYLCILKEGTKIHLKEEKFVITKYARIQTFLSKYYNNEKESYCDHLLLFLMTLKEIVIQKHCRSLQQNISE